MIDFESTSNEAKDEKTSMVVSFLVPRKRLIAIVNKEQKENEAKGINSRLIPGNCCWEVREEGMQQQHESMTFLWVLVDYSMLSVLLYTSEYSES